MIKILQFRDIDKNGNFGQYNRCWYAFRERPTTEQEKVNIFAYQGVWKNTIREYFHKDKVWRKSTYSKAGFTAYFKSKEELVRLLPISF